MTKILQGRRTFSFHKAHPRFHVFVPIGISYWMCTNISNRQKGNIINNFEIFTKLPRYLAIINRNYNTDICDSMVEKPCSNGNVKSFVCAQRFCLKFLRRNPMFFKTFYTLSSIHCLEEVLRRICLTKNLSICLVVRND